MKINFFDKFIEKQFSEGLIDNKYPNDKGNVMVCCPFPHKRKTLDKITWEEKTEQFYEKIPSASINKDMGAFNCFVCGEHFNELGFAQALTGKEKEEIIKDYLVKEELKDVSNEWQENQHKALLDNYEILQKLADINISNDIIKQLHLGVITNCLATPVFINNELVNVARYNINKLPNIPKVRYNEKASVGDIVPFDVWKNDFDNTIICEGEKDMLIARSFGFNAITLTGGSQSSIKKEYLSYFKDRNVNIVFDNDDAGKIGAKKLYKDLQDVCNVFITDISFVCKEEKEDVGDFFNKYKGTREQFIDLLKNHSKKLTKNELDNVKTKNVLEFTKLSDNIKNSKLKSRSRSSFQIIATCTDTYAIPEYAIFRLKEGIEGMNDENKKIKTWFLKDSPGDFLELMEGKIKTKDIPNILANMCFLPAKWYDMYNLELGKLKTIYKYVVTDEVKDTDEKINESTIDLYSFIPLDIGSIYDVEYKIFPHPREGQKLIAMANEIKQTTYKFDINDRDLLYSLDQFKATNVSDKLNQLYESARCHTEPYIDKTMWLLMELVFNSPLDITYKVPMRGALDVFVLGDTRTGKSKGAEGLIKLYDFGEKVTLKTATVASLVGGTDERLKKTKLGVLPRYHKELVVMEEFSGAPMDFIKTLTEIRSSNMVKIYRVAGELQAPCKLRMLTISNPLSSLDIESYPNGIEPINELIRSPEDVARYDAFMIIAHSSTLTNPFTSKLREDCKIDKKHYENKIKWIKSLGSENVIIDEELGNYIFEKGLQLNDMFNCSFKIFSSETDKKIARLSAALACMLCDTNDYIKVNVRKEHVDIIVNFLINLYDNPIFRLKDFANEEKSFRLIKEEDTKLLQEIYPKNVTLLEFLSNNSRIGRNELITMSGLDRDEFTKIFNILASRKFIKLSKDQVIPTIKFRNTYRLIDKSFNLYDMNNNNNVNTQTIEDIFG